MYEALTGVPPIMGDNSLHTIMLKESAKPLLLSQRLVSEAVPAILDKVIAVMLRTDPQLRQQSMSQVLSELSAVAKVTSRSGVRNCAS